VKKNLIWFTVYSFKAITKESLELEIWNFERNVLIIFEIQFKSQKLRKAKFEGVFDNFNVVIIIIIIIIII